MFGALAKTLFGSANDRRLKTFRPKVAAINALEAEIAKLADAATKISRALLEMAARREDEEIVKQRERRLRVLRGGRN